MSTLTLYDQDGHRNVLLPDQDAGAGVQTNQHVIVHNGEAMILDPGGTKLYTKVFKAWASEARRAKLTKLFLSHQDPDIVAALNGWLMTTDCEAYCSALWRHFIPHFGSDKLVYDRCKPIPDEGMMLNLGGLDLWIVPAHFLHSVGNFHVYDPVSKILYTGDLGVSLGQDQRSVEDFEAHIPLMETFHTRYMSSTKALRLWTAMVRKMDVQTIAPQHGGMLVGPEMVQKFLDWCDTLECGVDAIPNIFTPPT